MVSGSAIVVLFGAATALVAFFAIHTLFPAARRCFDQVADRRTKELREEFLELSATRVRAAILAVGGVLGLAAALFTRSALLALVAATVPPLFSGLAVRRYSARRRRRIVSQLPAFLDLLSGHVKAGHSISEALCRMQETLPPGIREEVAWIARTNRLGTPLPECLFLWEKRIPAKEITLLVRTLATAIPAGGNLPELLGQTRDILRLEARSRERLKSLTAQARLQAVVLSLLPPAFAAAVSVVDPTYLSAVAGTPQGKTLIVCSIVLQVAGWIVIRKILSEKA